MESFNYENSKIESDESCESNTSSLIDPNNAYIHDHGNMLLLNNAHQSSESVETNFNPPSLIQRREFHMRVSHKVDAERNSKRNVVSNQPGKNKPRVGSISKNAIMARLNREKRKKHLQNLEYKMYSLSEENENLLKAVDRQNKTIKSLKLQVEYFRRILANSSEISAVLKAVTKANLPVNSSITQSSKNSKVIVEKNPEINRISENVGISGDISSISNPPVLGTSSLINDNIFDQFETVKDPLLSDALLFDDQNLSLLDEAVSSFNYLPDNTSQSFDVGVCLHIANKRVSIEFCPICCANAQDAWQKCFPE